MQVNFIVLPGSVVINYDGKTIPIVKGDGRYESIIKAIKEQRIDDLPALVDVERLYKEFGNGIEVKGDELLLDGEPMPAAIGQRIMDFKKEGLPFDYLLKFYQKLKANPSFNSRQMLYKFLEHNGHPITKDGNFIAYRGVTDDFKDKHTGKFDNSVGSVCEMPRDQVDDNPNNTCSNGLHVASYDYAKGFASQVVEVEVDPVDVVCVPVDYNGTKMRVCKFKVVNVSKGSELKEVVYGEETLEEQNQSDLELNISSSAISKAVYSPSTLTLTITLSNGSIYEYADVPRYVVDDLEDSGSQGRYYVNNIKDNYDYIQVG